MKLRQQAESMMRAVIKEHRIFQHVLPYIIQEGTSVLMVRDALKVLCAALEWDYEYVTISIGSRGMETIDVLMDKLNNMKGRMDNEILTLACRADDLLNHRKGEEDNYFVLNGEGGQEEEPGVFQGQFKF